MATAGDVNGDFYSDIIVGAPYFTNGQTAEGKAFVYHGSSAGLSTTANWSYESNQIGANFGYSVGTAGTVNNDAFSEVIIGAPYFDHGQTDEGSAFVYHGSAGGLNTTPNWIGESDEDYANYGWSVSTAGDINGDGYADIIIGAPDYGIRDEGSVFVYVGSASGLSSIPFWTSESYQSNASYGCAVGTAGDFNGDGYGDIIIGSCKQNSVDPAVGAVFIYFGSLEGLPSPTTPSWNKYGTQTDAMFGFSVATAGDINGDGYSDVIIGQPLYDGLYTNAGKVWVYRGVPSQLGEKANWFKTGDQYGGMGAHFGFRINTAGDVNGDGYADVVIGAPGYDNGEVNEGTVFVFLGSSTGLSSTANWSADSDQAYAYLGAAVATAGDVNNDGYSELIIGAPNYDHGETDEGAAFLVMGSESGPQNLELIAEGNQDSSFLGGEVETAGDVNGDGYADVIIGQSSYSNDQTLEGRVLVYYGPTPLNTVADWSFESNIAYEMIGMALGTAGDVNSDGYSDIIVGDDLYDDSLGRVFVFFGSLEGLSESRKWVYVNEDPSIYHFGKSVDTAGDVNGDGYADIIIGTWMLDYGMALAFYGTPTGLGDSPDWIMENDQLDSRFGYNVTGAGDINGDGFGDVLVSADLWEENVGMVYAYAGSIIGLQSAPYWVGTGENADDVFGWSIASAGDVNGDGYADILVGSDLYYQPDAGAVSLYYGNNSIGMSLKPMQRNYSSLIPISYLGKSDELNLFRLTLLGRTPFGIGHVKLEWEVKPLGTPFNGMGTQISPTWFNTGVGGTELIPFVNGFSGSPCLHWRMRLHYHPALVPFMPASRWITNPWGGWNETKLRTPDRPVFLPLIVMPPP